MKERKEVDDLNKVIIKTASKQYAEGENESHLINVITDPHAAENDWLEACEKLKAHSQISKPRKMSKRKSATIVAFLCISLGIFAAALYTTNFFHGGSSKQEQQIDFGPYMEALQKEIKSKWRPPTNQDAVIKIHFKVHPNGELSDVGFERMSRLSESDAAALKAIVEAMPALPPLPSGVNDAVDISFTFVVEHFDKPER